MRMTDGDLWHKCATCVKVYSDDVDPEYEELRAGLEGWFVETQSNELPATWREVVDDKTDEQEELCWRMKRMYLLHTSDYDCNRGQWNKGAIEREALDVMKALEAYFGKEYC